MIEYFTELPRIRSERPAFELHYPHMIERIHNEAHVTFTGKTIPHDQATPALSEMATNVVESGTAAGAAEPDHK